jgi:hypothetical protein
MADVKGGYLRPTKSSFISSSFDDHKRRNPPSTEPAVDYGVAYGTSLYAVEDGTVTLVDHTTAGAEGRRLSIALNDGQMASSIHLSKILVNSGQKVKRGDLVAYTGASAWGKEWGVGAHVHQTLFPTHAHTFGTHNTLNHEAYIGDDNDNFVFDQTVANEQNFLNAAQGEKLIVDGLLGPATIAAIKRYQTYLQGRGWYGGLIDGDWGAGTQAGHTNRYNEWVAQTTPKPNPSYHKATVNDLADLQYVNGLQKVAHLYGYGRGTSQSTWMDNRWGAGSAAGLQAFLNQNYGGSLAAWLRSKWGYADNDDNWGPNMKAAAARAEAANYKAL